MRAGTDRPLLKVHLIERQEVAGKRESRWGRRRVGREARRKEATDRLQAVSVLKLGQNKNLFHCMQIHTKYHSH